MAARRRVEGGGDFAFDWLVNPTLRVQSGRFRQQGLRVGVVGLGEQFIRRRAFHHAAQIHDHHPVAEMLHHAKVMADEQVSQPQIFPQVHEQVQHLRLDRNVQRRDRLVTHNEIGLNGQRAGDADALALPAGELVRIALLVGRVEPHTLHRHCNVIIHLAALDEAVEQRRLADDLRHF